MRSRLTFTYTPTTTTTWSVAIGKKNHEMWARNHILCVYVKQRERVRERERFIEQRDLNFVQNVTSADDDRGRRANNNNNKCPLNTEINIKMRIQAVNAFCSRDKAPSVYMTSGTNTWRPCVCGHSARIDMEIEN